MVSLGRAARIAGLNESTLSNWRMRPVQDVFKKLAFFSDPPEKGQSARVDRTGVIMLAIMARLVPWLTPMDAAHAALRFTQRSDAQELPGDRGAKLAARLPGQLYAEGHTLLIITRNTNAADLGQELYTKNFAARVVQMFDGTEFFNHEFLLDRQAFISVNLNEVIGAVDTELSAHDERADEHD